MDRITRLTYPDNDVLHYEYNARGSLARLYGDHAGDIISGIEYMPTDQFKQSHYGDGVRSAYSYDHRLRLVELLTQHQSVEERTGSERMGSVRRNVSEASQLQPVHISRTDPLSAPLLHFQYDFDRVSNIRAIHDLRPDLDGIGEGATRRNTQLFNYDSLYRLNQVQYSFNLPGEPQRNDGQIDYRYDRIGNMVS